MPIINVNVSYYFKSLGFSPDLCLQLNDIVEVHGRKLMVERMEPHRALFLTHVSELNRGKTLNDLL
jgi:hypothetical protein